MDLANHLLVEGQGAGPGPQTRLRQTVEELLWRAIELGVPAAYYGLATVLCESGRADEAEDPRRRSCRGHHRM